MSKWPLLNTSIVKCGQLLWPSFALFDFSQSKKRGSKISNGKWGIKNLGWFVYINVHEASHCNLLAICCRRLFVKVAFGHKQGYMVEKPITIHRSPFVFLTHLESAINKLQLINWEELVNKEPCQRMDLLTMVVESLFVIVIEKRLIHIHNLISGMVKYKIWGFDQITIVQLDLDKNVETFQMPMIMAHPLFVLNLMYYEFLLRRFAHKWWGDVCGGCATKRPTPFTQPFICQVGFALQGCQ